MSDSESSFFKELQVEFLSESAFMFEQYEESMLGLESGANIQTDLAQIFRVAHSIKGGASAVGFPDLAKFAHVVEDLLALLRTQPEHLNSGIISLLLRSGDVLKIRILSLQKGENIPWDPSDLAQELVQCTRNFISNGRAAPIEAIATVAASAEAVDAGPLEIEVVNNMPLDPISDLKIHIPQGPPAEDIANHELLAELGALMIEPSSLEKAPSEAKPLPAVEAAAAPPAFKTPSEVSVPEKNATEKVIESKPAAKNPAENTHKTSTKQISSSIKVDTARVDSVLDAVGELVVLKNQIIHDESIRNGGNLRLAGIVDQLDKTVRELYDKTLSIRMTPLKSLFLKIQRIVRDVSLSLNKPVELELVGEETEVERAVFELLGDPLVHLVRNAMDHGIEKPEIRKEKGKAATAKVRVSARQTGGTVTIEIVDDGGGINREKVLAKAKEKNLIPAGSDPTTFSDEQVFQYIFAPGFSTAEKVSDLSGRGVGLDVVRSNLEKINGKIDIRSKLGQGTTFRLSIPLSTAITDGIVIALDGAKYILPIYSIREIVRTVPKDYVQVSDQGRVVKIRESLLPVIDIQKTLGEINWEQIDGMKYRGSADNQSLRARREESMVIIIESMHGMLALPVDEVIGQAQVVVKPITTGRQIAEVSGAAILGDGRTVLILDPIALTQRKNSDHAKDFAA